MIQAATSSAPALDTSAKLNATIQRFAAPHDMLASERRILPETPRARLTALLREIEETVMPRRIALCKDGRAIAHMTVSNRRLFKITPNDETAGTANTQDVTTLATDLLELSKGVECLAIEAHREEAPNLDGGSGFGADKIEQALGLGADDSDILILTDLLAPIALAQITWTDTPAQHHLSGAETWRSLLKTHAERVTSEIASRNAHKLPSDPGATGMALPLSDETLLVIAWKDTSGVASVAPRDAGLKAISTWQITSKHAQ